MRWRYLQLCEQNGFVPRLPKTWIHGLANRSPVLSFANLLSKRTDDEVRRGEYTRLRTEP